MQATRNRAASQSGSRAGESFASGAFARDAVVDEDAVDEGTAAATAVSLQREASNGFVCAGFPKFGHRPPRGPGRLPGVLLTVLEPTGHPMGVVRFA